MMTSFVFKKRGWTPASFSFDGDGLPYTIGQKSSYLSTDDITLLTPSTPSMYYLTGTPGYYTPQYKLSYNAWINPMWLTQNYPVEFFSFDVPTATGDFVKGNITFCYDFSRSTLQFRFNGIDENSNTLYNLYEAPISVGGSDYNSSLTTLTDKWTTNNNPDPWIHIGFIFDANAGDGSVTTYTVGTEGNELINQYGMTSNRVKIFWNGSPLLTYEYNQPYLPANYLGFYRVFSTPFDITGACYLTLGGKTYPGAHRQDQVGIRLGNNVFGNSMISNYYNNPSVAMNGWAMNGIWNYPAKGGETSSHTSYGTDPILTPYSAGTLSAPVLDTIIYKA